MFDWLRNLIQPNRRRVVEVKLADIMCWKDRRFHFLGDWQNASPGEMTIRLPALGEEHPKYKGLIADTIDFYPDGAKRWQWIAFVQYEYPCVKRMLYS